MHFDSRIKAFVKKKSGKGAQKTCKGTPPAARDSAAQLPFLGGEHGGCCECKCVFVRTEKGAEIQSLVFFALFLAASTVS